MSTPEGTSSSYTCPYCRHVSDGGGTSCTRCGAPVDIRLKVTKSGWAKQPPIADMARIRFNRSTCQISGTQVPVAEMKLDGEDSVYFSHHVLLHTDPNIKMESKRMAGGWNRVLAGMPLIMLEAKALGTSRSALTSRARRWRSRCSRTRPSMSSSTVSCSRPAMSTTPGSEPGSGSPRRTGTSRSGITPSAR